ncbi:ABC-F family ATP-binding cassette domain-containing protein [Pelagibacterium sp.]|uniref:ABC-F family ATP-binding cassette domain-containing protein n=1 Tax=Pelagibacterium sp. TaxID=1967288 RepID=UPI003BAD9D63
MAAPLLALQSIRLVMGSTPLLEGADLSVAPGEKIALVGRNGSGKSTLLKIAAGTIEPDGGERFFQPGATVRYLPQEPDLSGFETTLAYVEGGLEGADDNYRAQYLLEQLGLTGRENPASLSGGEARRAALARVLAPEPDILLLDEPTNHLDLPVIEWLEEELKSLRSALVLISHDRRFLSDLTRSTVWIDRGQTRRIDQGFGAFEAWRDDFLEQEEKEQHKLARKIAAEEHWVRYGVTARRKRNVRRMDLLSGLRQQVKDYRGPQGTVKMTVAEGRSSGAMVVEAENIHKAFGKRVVVEDFSTRVMRGSRVGIVGPNGAGKTTLIRMLTGEIEPDSGTVRLGTRLELAVLDQRRASLDPEATLKDVLTGGGSDTLTINGQPKHVIGYMKEFLFTPEQARTVVSKLSGGERNRVTLARALALPSNVLVLDEPTNDLDLETLDLLEEMIADYQGTVIVVSHDRDFLDKVATSIVVAEGDGDWNEYAGGYTDMVAQRGAGVSARKVEKPAPAPKGKSAPAAAPPQQKRKLSFKDKHALETLPREMDGVRAKMTTLQALLDDPGLYNRDPGKFQTVTAELASAQEKLAGMEDRWLELELLREDIEG